jgi:hypothetical protein
MTPIDTTDATLLLALYLTLGVLGLAAGDKLYDCYLDWKRRKLLRRFIKWQRQYYGHYAPCKRSDVEPWLLGSERRHAK